jgi:hypothetical protein
LVLPLWALLLSAGCESKVLTVTLSNPLDPGGPAVARLEEAPVQPPEESEARYAARLEAALSISSPFERDDALAGLAAEAAAGQGGVVKRCLAAISNPFTKDETARRCALRLARAGRGEEAVEVARSISNPFERDAVLKKMAADR